MPFIILEKKRRESTVITDNNEDITICARIVFVLLVEGKKTQSAL